MAAAETRNWTVEPMKCSSSTWAQPSRTQPAANTTTVETNPTRRSQGSAGVGSNASTSAIGTQMLQTVCSARLHSTRVPLMPRPGISAYPANESSPR